MPIITQAQLLQLGAAQVAALPDSAAQDNAIASLLAASPWTPASLQGATQTTYTTNLPHFTLAPDNTPQLVIPAGWTPAAPAPVSPTAEVVSSTAGSITVPAGQPCPQGFTAQTAAAPSYQQIEAMVRQSAAQAAAAAGGGLIATGACVPAAGVTTQGKWVTQDDFLAVAVTNASIAPSLVLNARVLDCNGDLHYLAYSLTGTPQCPPNTWVLGLTPGYLLDVSVNAPGASTLKVGYINVVIALQQSGQCGLAPVSVLAQGYITGIYGISWPSAPGGAPAAAPTPVAPVNAPILQQCAQGYTGIATTISVGYTHSLQAGSLLVAFAYINESAGPSTTISDTGGNTWVWAVGPTWDAAVALWYCLNSNAGSCTVTLNNSSTNVLQLQVYEISGWVFRPALTGSGHASTVSSTPSVSASPSLPGYAISLLWTNGGTPFTGGTGWTLQQQQAGSFGLNTAGEDMTVAAAGTVTATFGMTASAAWGQYILCFG